MASAPRLILLLFLAFLAVFTTIAAATDPSPLHDFCVADNTTSVLVNGLACKDPKTVTSDDFFLSGLDKPGNTSNPQGSFVNLKTVHDIPGLNTLGISFARVDYAPWGLNSPHIHPRATELFTVIKGTVLAGFITSSPENRLVTKLLHEGDVFVFPVGLVHFQSNRGSENAIAVSALSSQNPGIIRIANAVFGSNPDIDSDILAKAFQLDKEVISYRQSKF